MLKFMQAYHWESGAFPTNHHVDYQPWVTVGGLATYFLGIQNLPWQSMPDAIVWQVKKLIVELKRSAPGSPDGLGLAYNGVRDFMCPVLSPGHGPV